MGAFAQAQSLDNLFETALGTAGLTIESARFDPATVPFYYQPRFESLAFRQFSNHPWRTPFVVQNYRDELSRSSDNVSEVISTGSRLLGVGVSRSLLGNPIARAEQIARRPDGLTQVLNQMREAGLIKDASPSQANLPEPVKQAAALVLQVALDTVPMRRSALLTVPSPDAFYDRLQTPALADDALARHSLDEERFQLNYMAAAGQDLAMAATAARTLLLGVATDEKFDWRLNTAWGTIVLSGGTDSRWESGVLLLIDTGGNDQFIGLPANRSAQNWLSVVLDGAGNDQYLSHAALARTPVAQFEDRKTAKAPGPGSAAMGISMLYDLRGNDLYRTATPGIASAKGGIAVVSDADGNDIYDAYSEGLGAATFGIGVLEDQVGSDRYSGFSQVQGFGGVLGFGAVIDRLGDDRFEANNQVIDFPSPQTAQSNVSMAQGAGQGRRADFSDGKSASGGIGVLFDLSGNDTYSAGVFAQGVGYWGGTGMLFDSIGNDTYTGGWYVQGASAHFAVGILEDGGGDDTYTAALNMAMAAAHDFSLSYLIDRGGADRYDAPNLSLGAGNANGIGVFLDFDGNDQYKGTGLTLGRAAEAPKGTLRARCLTLGLFYDGQGTDVYPQMANWARDASRVTNWTDRGYTAAESQLGIFWDR